MYVNSYFEIKKFLAKLFPKYSSYNGMIVFEINGESDLFMEDNNEIYQQRIVLYSSGWAYLCSDYKNMHFDYPGEENGKHKLSNFQILINILKGHYNFKKVILKYQISRML